MKINDTANRRQLNHLGLYSYDLLAIGGLTSQRALRAPVTRHRA